MIFPMGATQINAGDGSIIISNGDDATITGNVPDGSKSGYVWLYTGNYATLMYGEPIIINSDIYTIKINKSVSINSGKYKIFVEFAGENNIPEVIWDKSAGKLTSPWRYVHPVDVPVSDVPNQIMKFCYDNSKYCDDTFTNSTLFVEGSFIKFSEQYQVQNDEKDITKNGLMYVGGTTNLATTNTINVTLDYTQKVKATIEELPSGYNKWYAYINISRLRAGDHTILIQSSKTDDLKHILTISEYIPTPKPTPTPIRYVKNEMREFVAVTNTPIIKTSVTPIIVNDSNRQFVPVITADHTPPPAPVNATMIVPTKTNKISYMEAPSPESNGKLPLDISIIIISLLLAIIVLVKRK